MATITIEALMAKRGRKNHYPSRVEPRLEEIRRWCRDGLTDIEICERLGVSVSRFNEYKNQFQELRETLREHKEVADGKVEDSLYQRAIGFEYIETIIEKDAEGREKGRREILKRVLPDVTAIIIWLKNRQPDQWRDKQDVDVTGRIIYQIGEAKKPKPETTQ